MRHYNLFFSIVVLCLICFWSCSNNESSSSNTATKTAETVKKFDNAKTKAQTEDKKEIAELILMPEPKWDNPNSSAQPKEDIVMVYLKAESNDITDIEKWFETYDIDYDYCANSDFVKNKKVLKCGFKIPQQHENTRLLQAHYGNEYNFAVYGKDFSGGRYVSKVDAMTGEVSTTFDFKRYLYSPKFNEADAAYIKQSIQWVEEENGVLYMANHHNTYAKSSGNFNGYINAIDLETGKLLWRSNNLVCNSNNFIVYGNYIISGYGFTKEDDFLYVLDKSTGNTYGRIPVKTAPEWLFERDNKVYVRSYNTDYIVAIALDGVGTDIEKIEK